MINQLSPFISKKAITFWVMIFFSISINSQIPGLTQFTINDGLPSNTVYDIAQDSKGNLIIATDYGISKYDGISFKNYTVNDGLPDNEILYLFKDTKNRIWFIGFNGKIAFYKNNIIYNNSNIDFLKKLQFKTYIHDIHEDKNGNVWFLDSHYNLTVLNNKDEIIKQFKVNKYKNSSHSYLIENKFNKVQLITSNNEPIIYDISTNQNIKEISFDSANFSAKMIEKIRNKRASLLRVKDKTTDIINNKLINHTNISQNNLLYKTYHFNNKYWVTSLNKGAYIFDYQNLYNSQLILPNYQTTRAFQDREKNIWIGTTSNGIILFPDYNTSSYHFDNAIDNDLYTVDVLNNQIFVGNNYGKITVLNEKTLEQVKSISLNKSEMIDRIRNGKIYNNELHFMSNDNYIIIDKNLNITSVFHKDHLKNPFNVNKSFKSISHSKNLTFIANAGGIFSIDIKTKEKKQVYIGRTTAIIVKKDTTWFGNINGLHYIYNNIQHKPDLPHQFNETIITDFDEFNNGIVIGTNSRGIGFYKNRKLSIININDGLLSNSVKSIFIAPNNELWVATNYGVNRIKVDQNFKPVNIESFTISEGLNTNDVRNCFVTKEKAYIATSKGLNIINLKSKRAVFEKPTTHMNEIILNNELISLENNQAFESNKNNIQFNYSGISFKSIGHISFKYRLVGLENDWIYSNNNSVRYAALPFGNYTFELKSITKNGIESANTYQFSFRVKRPFYHTWFFRISIFLLVFLAISYFYIKRINYLKKNKLIEEKISNLRFQALNAQMNPHFINNLLTMIISLIDSGKREKAINCLMSFSKMVNLVLQSTKTNLISLDNELNIVVNFIELNSLKYKNQISYNINTNYLEPEDLEAIKIPPMILQPIIENCIRHGLVTNHPNPTIEINLKIENEEFLICTITDNGTGYTKLESTSKDSGISLNNIDERLMLMNEKNSGDSFITFTNLSDEFPNLAGTKVELKIPLIYM